MNLERSIEATSQPLGEFKTAETSRNVGQQILVGFGRNVGPSLARKLLSSKDGPLDKSRARLIKAGKGLGKASKGLSKSAKSIFKKPRWLRRLGKILLGAAVACGVILGGKHLLKKRKDKAVPDQSSGSQ
jgi:hypothetical protein